MAAKFPRIVSLRATDLLDKTMEPEAFENSGGLRSVFTRKMQAQMLVLETPNIELAASDDFKQGLVFLIKKVESRVATLIVDDGPREFVQMFNPTAAIIQ